jgi:hypothetical protein
VGECVRDRREGEVKRNALYPGEMRGEEWVSDVRDYLQWRIDMGDLDWDDWIFRSRDICDQIIAGYLALRGEGFTEPRPRGRHHGRYRSREK